MSSGSSVGFLRMGVSQFRCMWNRTRKEGGVDDFEDECGDCQIIGDLSEQIDKRAHGVTD